MSLSLERKRPSQRRDGKTSNWSDRPTTPLVMELVGPAGTGKTTLLRALGAQSNGIRAGVRVHRIRDLPDVLVSSCRMVPVLLASLRHPRAGWSAVRHLIRLNTLLAIVTRLKRERTQTIVLDEGPTFVLTRLAAFHDRHVGGAFFESAWEHGLRRTAEVLDAIVWLDAPDSTLARRIRDREKSHRIKGASDSELRHFLHRYRDTYSRVVERIANRGATRVLRFDTSRLSPDGIVRELSSVAERQDG